MGRVGSAGSGTIRERSAAPGTSTPRVARQVEPRRWHPRSQPGHELLRLEHERRRPAPPAPPQAAHQPAAVEPRQPLAPDRLAGDIAAEPHELLPIAGRHGQEIWIRASTA